MSDAIKKLNGTVPKNLKQILKKSGVRQCDLAKSVGLTRQNITDIVSCRRLIHASEIEAIADALDVTPNDLFGIAPTERTGEWIVYPLKDEGRVELECPECRYALIRAADRRPHFCENCGAKMKGDNDEK